MSDIWIKTSSTATTKWRKAVNIYIKRFSSTWVAAKVIWIKNTSAGWLRVWPTSGVFAITDPYITTTSSGSTPLYGNQTVGTNDVIRIGTTYYGRNGTWDPNGFSISSYNYTWRYYSDLENQPGDFDLLGDLGTGVYSSPSQALTINTQSAASSVDGKYISFKITANASNSLYSNSADSKDSYGKIRVIRRTPINISFGITGSTTVGSVLSVGSSWNITEARKPDAGRTTIKWYRSDSSTAIYSGGGRTEITSASGSYQYTIVQADSGKYIVAEETTFNTGSDYDIGVDQFVNGQNQVTAVSSIITSPYRFAFGNILYVSSNGHIGLDSGSSSYTSMSSGRNIAVFVKDLEQYYLAEYSDNSSYYLYIKSYLYDTSASSLNALDYQIRFYNDSSINYCDVYVVRRGSNLGSTSDFAPGYYSSGTTGHIAGFNSISAGTGFRVFFGGSAATTPLASWTGVPDSLWDVIQTWTYPGGGGDDTFTAVTSAANQQAAVPVNTVLPTLTTDTGNFSAGSTITINSGTWTNANSFQYELLYGTSTPIATDSSATKTLVNTNQYVITNSDASAGSFYFRGRVTGYSGSGQTGNSAIALSTTSARSTLNPTTTISVGTATSSGFTISGTAGPLTGFGGTYVNVTSIQIFNSSFGLVSTITTGLPSVNGTTGAWSYVWTGHSGSSATYYAKATVTATDSAQTTFTTAFSSSISTVSFTSPTISSVTYNTSNNTWTVNYTGGSGPFYQIWYQPISSNSVPSLTGSETSTADASSSSSTSTSRVLTPSSGTAYYWWVRSANSLNATGVGNVTAWNGPVTMSPMNTATPTLTGTAKVGQVLTYGIGSWINFTSQDLRLYRGTVNVATFETLSASSTSTSSTYTIPSSDFTDPNNRKYYRSFANVSNGSFSSGFTAGTEIGPLVNLTLYTITFDSKSGTAVSSLTQTTEGGSIAQPTNPTRTSFNFGGWSTTDGGTTAVSWPRTPTSNQTLYAIWTSASVSPSAPTGLSVSRSVGSNFMSTSLSPSGSGNSTKTQTWSFGRNTTFTINFTRGANATSSEMYYSTSSSTPSSSTSQNGGSSTSSSGSFSYVGAASTTNDNDYAVYFWVRSTTATEKSAWTYAGTQNVDTPLYSGFEIRLYRTNTSSGIFTTQNPGRNALTYDWTSVATGFAHQAQVRLTFDGTQLIRSS